MRFYINSAFTQRVILFLELLYLNNRLIIIEIIMFADEFLLDSSLPPTNKQSQHDEIKIDRELKKYREESQSWMNELLRRMP